MTSATIVVIDGLGIGAMPDVGNLRSGDATADTLGSIVAWRRERGQPLRLPHLTALGLDQLRPDLALEASGLQGSGTRIALGYPGADTFAGHQTLMGADMSHVVLSRVGEQLGPLAEALRTAGHAVETLDGLPLLVVDGEALVHDNLEADPALNWNVSARLTSMSWEQLLEIATIVRQVAPVARVIAVGGVSDGDLRQFVRPGEQGTVGLDTPASGFYRNGGLQVQHLGTALDHRRQLPEMVASAGLPVTLVGKAADILVTDTPVTREPGVDTATVLADTLAAAGRGLVVTNVQQTDLAGHSQDVSRWADLLEQTDAAIGSLTARLRSGDLLVVTGDHGNDPTIGHNFHTREFVPALATRAGGAPWPGTTLDSLADLGATVASWLRLDPGALGNGRAIDPLSR